MKLNRLTLTLGLLVILALLIVASFAVQRVSRDGGKALVGGPFQLIDQDGLRADEALLKGRWSLVFFGFTNCPDVCPGTLQVLGATAIQLGPEKANDLQVVFVTIDPERDTPATLKAYLNAQRLPLRVVGLSGSAEQIKAAALAYRVFYEPAKLDGGGYTMNHSTAVYLIDREGHFDRVLAFGLTPSEMATQIEAARRGA